MATITLPPLHTTGSHERRSRRAAGDSGQRVTPLELFFDLVFVFAITQVTGFWPRPDLARPRCAGMLLLAVLWWAWAAYAWLTNTLNPEEGGVRLVVFCSIAAMLIVRWRCRTRSARRPGLRHRLLHRPRPAIGAVRPGGRGDKELLRAVVRTAPGAVLGPAFLVVAAFFDGSAHLALWGAALRRLRRRAGGRDARLAGLAGALRRAARADRDHRARRVDRGHWRRGAGLPLDAGVLVAAVLGMVVIAARCGGRTSTGSSSSPRRGWRS